MFSSSPLTPGTPSKRAASSPNSSTVSPAMLTITGVCHVAHIGATSRTSASTPTFWRPIVFSIPDGVSAMRVWGLPARGLSVVPLLTIAPSRWMSNTFAASSPLLKVPDAVITGLRRGRPCLRRGASSTARFKRVLLRL